MLMADILDYIDGELPCELGYTLSVMNRRKLIKAVILTYLKLVKETLISGNKFTIRDIGRLEPYIRHIGAKLNPFTGQPCKERDVNDIRFKLARRLKDAIH